MTSTSDREARSSMSVPAPPALPSISAAPPASASVPAAGTHFDAQDARIFEQAYKDFRESWVDSGEKEYIRRLLLRHDRNVAAAAREAEVDRTYIYRLIRKHEL
jgi:transcriptional regulator of acetoin/glycerol metabolism